MSDRMFYYKFLDDILNKSFKIVQRCFAFAIKKVLLFKNKLLEIHIIIGYGYHIYFV